MRGAGSKLAAVVLTMAACSSRSASRDGARPGQWVPSGATSAAPVATAPVPSATPAKSVPPVAALESEPKDMRIDGDVGEWDVPAPAASSWSARIAATPAGVTVAGRVADGTKVVFVTLALGPTSASPLVRTREGYRADASCEESFSGPARTRCEKSLREQGVKLIELGAPLRASFELTQDGVKSADSPLRGSTGALKRVDGATAFELRVLADDLPAIAELPVRVVKLGVSRTDAPTIGVPVALPKPVTPGRLGVVAGALWPATGVTTEARAHVLGLYRPSETSPALRFLDLDGAPMPRGGPVPPMSEPVIVDVPIPAGRTLVSKGDVEVQERTALGRRVVTSHKAGVAVGEVMAWDERTSKVRKTAIRAQGIDVLVEMVVRGVPGPPDNIALRVLRCAEDGRVQTVVDFGNAFLSSERFEDATLSTFGVRGKGWRPRELADLDLRWSFDAATGAYRESHTGF